MKQKEKKLLLPGGEQVSNEVAAVEKAITEIKGEIAAAYKCVKDSENRKLQIYINWVKNLSDDDLASAGILEFAKQERNRILGDLMVIARRVHDYKENFLHYSRASINSLFDFTQIIATSVGSIAGSEQTARALAVAATGSAAMQESFDTRFFYQHATTAVISIMKKQRHKAEQVLIMNMSKDVIEYPLQVALVDYTAFLLAGGLTDALTELNSDAKIKELEQLEKLNELKKMSEEHLLQLRQQAEQNARAESTRKERQSAYLGMVDSQLMTRIQNVLSGATAASASLEE